MVYTNTWQTRSKIPQFLATAIISIGGFITGTVLGWSSPVIPALNESLDLGELTPEEQSWIASLPVLGALSTGWIAGYVTNQLGRKRSMVLLTIPSFIRWLLIAFSGHFGGVAMMYAGRLITGFCAGCFLVVIPVFITEIVEDKYRGILTSTMVLMLVSGILFTFSVAAVVTWFWLTLFCALFPVILFFSLFIVPETPRFLLLRGQKRESCEALKWLRGANNAEIQPELNKLQDSIENNNITGSSVASSLRQLLKPETLKPTTIALALFLFQQLSGINAVCFYTVKILREANPQFDANIASIIIGVVQVVFVFVSIVLVDRVGRKLLLIAAFVIMGLSLIALGVFFKIKEAVGESNLESMSISFVPLVSLVAFIIAYSTGAGPLPWLVTSEILPPNGKDFATGIVSSFYWLLAFVGTKTFENLVVLLGTYGCYWLYAAICITGAIFTIVIIPETKNKSSIEIQQYFGAQIQTTFANETLLPYHDQKPMDDSMTDCQKNSLGPHNV